MSDHARQLTTLGPEHLPRAASLRIQAAEIKRAANASALAFEDYEALARYYLEAGRLKPAIAYMRKGLHVSAASDDHVVEVGRLLLATEVYVAAQQPELARGMAKDALVAAGKAGVVALSEKAATLFETAQMTVGRFKGLCGCGKDLSFTACCGAADVEPVEYSGEAMAIAMDRTPSPFRPSGRDAIETLMRPPVGAGGSTWFAWHVEDGCYRLEAYANWSGRAIRAAEAMARIAQGPALAETTSSAVLQAFVALQSFMTSWKKHMRRQTGRKHWPTRDGADRTAKGSHGDASSAFVGNWETAAKEAFGSTWKLPDREGFKALARIRNRLCHDAATHETVVPAIVKPEDQQVLDCLASRGFKLLGGPAPMIDRVMVEGIAAWAVEVAKSQMAAVQDAWDLADREREMQDWRDASMTDEVHDQSGDVGQGWDYEMPGPQQLTMPMPLEAGTSLRRLAAMRPNVIIDVYDIPDVDC